MLELLTLFFVRRLSLLTLTITPMIQASATVAKLIITQFFFLLVVLLYRCKIVELTILSSRVALYSSSSVYGRSNVTGRPPSPLSMVVEYVVTSSPPSLRI